MLPAREAVACTSLKTMPQTMVTKLAALSGIPEDTLERFWVRSGVIIPFGESSVKRKQINTKIVRYCPHCLIEDGKTHGVRRGGSLHVIPALNDQNPFAHFRCPIDMTRHGWVSSFRQASQQ